MYGALELLLGDVAVIALELLLGLELDAEVRNLALAALAVLAGAIFALVDRGLRAAPDVLAHAAIELVLGAGALRHDISFNCVSVDVDPGAALLDPIEGDGRATASPGCGANCEGALITADAVEVKVSAAACVARHIAATDSTPRSVRTSPASSSRAWSASCAACGGRRRAVGREEIAGFVEHRVELVDHAVELVLRRGRLDARPSGGWASASPFDHS